MKYEIFDIQNALNACRSSLKTLNISESTTTGTTAALLMHSRSSSPLIHTTRDISTMAMASTTKLGAKRHPIATSTAQKTNRYRTRQQQPQRRCPILRQGGINVRLFEYGRGETSFDSMSLLSTTSSSNTTVSYGLADKDFTSEYCYQPNYYPTTGTVYQPKPMIYSRYILINNFKIILNYSTNF